MKFQTKNGVRFSAKRFKLKSQTESDSGAAISVHGISEGVQMAMLDLSD